MSTINDYFLDDAAANADGYRSRERNIPFIIRGDSGTTIKVKLLFDKFENVDDFAGRLSTVKNKAVDRYILHFFPEYYLNYRVHRRGKGSAEDLDPIFEAGYRRLRQTLKDNITAVYYRPHDPSLRSNKDLVLASLELPLPFEITKSEVEKLKEVATNSLGLTPASVNEAAALQKIDTLDSPSDMNPTDTQYISAAYPSVLMILLRQMSLLPDMDLALETFNADEGISGGGGVTTLQIGSMVSNNNFVNDGLKTFQEQMNGFEGSLPNPIDFGSIQSSLMKILNIVVMEVVKDIGNDFTMSEGTVDLSGLEFSEADNIYIEFGWREDTNRPSGEGTAISGMSYIVNNLGPQRQVLRTGYMTNIVWNKRWRDPFTLDTLKMYETLVETMKVLGGLGGADFSFVDFLQSSPPGSFGFENNFDFSSLPKPGDFKNLFLKEAAKLNIIDLGDVKNLEKGWLGASGPLGVKQLREYRQRVRENPEIYKKVRMEEKKKVLKTAADITKHIGNVLDGDFPIPGMKKDSKLAVVIRQIGIQELAKEAIICLTFGLAPAFERLVSAVASAVQQTGQELYIEPAPPRPTVTMPPIDLEQFKPKTIDGDMWKAILGMMLDTLMEGVLEIIKQLAALLKEVCPFTSGRADDFGENDLADLIAAGATGIDLPQISNQSALDSLFGDTGLTFEEMMKYFSDLSPILSSVEICYLFINRAEIPYATVEKILDFNLSYENLNIRRSLNTYSSLLGFFARLSQFIDMSDFCNQVATDVYRENLDNICLLEEIAPPYIDETLRKIAEEGIKLDNPGDRINLDCPNKAGYVDNALVSADIPSVLNTVIEVIEMDFVNSLGAAQQALKVPDIETSKSAQLMGETLDAANATDAREEFEEMDKVGRDIMSGMQRAFEEINDLVDEMGEHCDVGEILGVEADTVADVIEVLVDVMSKLLDSGEFADAIQDIQDTIAGLQDATEGSTPVTPSYSFPRRFTSKFQNYLKTEEHSNVHFNPRSTTEWTDPAPLVTAGEFISQTPGLGNPAGSYSYRPLQLKFKFPQRTGPQKWARTAETYTSGLPKFAPIPTPPDSMDSLQITYPAKSVTDATGEYVKVALKSALLPTSSAAVDFNILDGPSTEPTRDVNPYVGLFTDPIMAQYEVVNEIYGSDESITSVKRSLDTLLFPSAFAGLVESSFNYIRKNGVFDITKLNSLTFFHDNRNCIPEDVADLLDIDGIMKELNDEMLDALCHDKPPGLQGMEGKIRDVIRYGMFLLLIQIHIAQFIVKNIFVFSAYHVNDLLGSPLTKEFLSIQIRDSVLTMVQSQPLIRNKMVEYFTKKASRSSTVAKGGLVNSDGEVIFPSGKTFNSTDFPAIVEYAAGLRIFNSKMAVANAVTKSSPNLSPKKFSRAFIEDVLGFEAMNFGSGPVGQGRATWQQADDSKGKRIRLKVNEAAGGGIGVFPAVQNESYFDRLGRNTIVERSLESQFQGIDDAHSYLRYGKFVLERKVVWDNVSHLDGGTVPEILSSTTGENYGIEIELFKEILFNHSAVSERNVTEDVLGLTAAEAARLQFEGVGLKYDIVYYSPYMGSHSQGTSQSDRPALARNIELAAHLRGPEIHQASSTPIGRFELARMDLKIPLAHQVSIGETEQRFGLMEIDGVTQYGTREEPILQTQLKDYGREATNSELIGIIADPVFDDYFGKAFNRDLVTLVPIMENYYLTTNFFPEYNRLLLAPKERCIQIFVDSVYNEDGFTQPEHPSPQAEAAMMANKDDPLSGLKQSAIDFILKMLIETPIQILRGVSEMMDPHVAIWKIVRDVTGFAFGQMAGGIDASGGLTPLKEVAIPPDSPEYSEEEGAENMMPGVAPNIDGEGVLKIIFCLLSVAMKATQAGFVLGEGTVEEGTVGHLPSPDSDNFLGNGPLGEAGAMFIGNPPKNLGSAPGLDKVEIPWPPGNPLAVPPIPPGPPTVLRPAWDGLKYTAGQGDPRDLRNNVPDEIKDNFFPKITVEGVDFTGTFLGLLCLPPGPFGIVYLLLMLLKGLLEEELEDAFDTEDGMDNVSGENASEC